jgi:hypothetical protein
MYCLSFWIALILYGLIYNDVIEPVYVFGIAGGSHLLAAWTGANYGVSE